MFIAVYEFEVKHEMEEQFKSSWLKLTEGIYLQSGSLGSRLHRAGKNLFIGYAQWPDKDIWQGAGDVTMSDEYVLARKSMRDALVRSRTVYQLEVEKDYLQSKLSR